MVFNLVGQCDPKLVAFFSILQQELLGLFARDAAIIRSAVCQQRAQQIIGIGIFSIHHAADLHRHEMPILSDSRCFRNYPTIGGISRYLRADMQGFARYRISRNPML